MNNFAKGKWYAQTHHYFAYASDTGRMIKKKVREKWKGCMNEQTGNTVRHAKIILSNV
ncbi:MAG: hypothetical protein KDJ65_24935 [Anaerolineae bacterium]|nr:hypothetical protein [Anaerolineae bacterium]